MRNHTSHEPEQQAENDNLSGRGSRSDPSALTPAQAAKSSPDSTRDSASQSISEVKARDPEYYAERDIPSET